ncbi:MAG: triose-phosphate isomerase [Maricaulaceae bacterium]
MLTPLIAANWKMNGDMSWTHKPIDLDKHLPHADRGNVEVLICPPFPFIAATSESGATAKVYVGGQACDSRSGGAFTGQVNAAMLKSAGASHVIAGHSERREMGETNANIKAQVESILETGLVPILCVGESIATRESGQAENFVAAQLKACWPNSVGEGVEIVVAYEPIWAIGTGKVPSLDDITAMHSAIRAIVGPKNRILYGGSVKPANAKDILALKDVNGALVGGASLDMESFATIAKSAQ